MEFEVLIDETFINNGIPVQNKHVLSILNDYEDGEWRYKKFQSFIWDNIAETSLSQEERCCLVDQSHSLLTAAAKNLRLTDKENDISKGSELAEIVLYGIMKNHYSALPVVPKIFYKQNAQDNAKGADSVHIVIEGENDFSLWFGEAKFYSSIENTRLSSIIKSVENSLKTDKLKKENSIITNIQDLDYLIKDGSLNSIIRNALSNRKSIDDLKPKIHIPIFLLHECECTNSVKKITDKYRLKLKKYHRDRATSYFNSQAKKLSNIYDYSKLNFHIILFPIPRKDIIVDKFIKNVEYYKDQ